MSVAKDIMTPYPYTVTKDTTVRELAEELARKHYSGAPVVNDNGGLIGIVTESDLIFQHTNLHLPTFFTLFDSAIAIGGTSHMDDDLKKMMGATVGDIMSDNVISVDEKATLDEIATVMSEERKHFLPVIKNDELTGVVDRSDLLRAFVKDEG